MASDGRRGHANFGLPLGASKPSPTQFTKAHEREPVLPEPAAPSVPKSRLKAPLPGRDEAPLLGLVSSKDYVRANALEAQLLPTRGLAPPPPPATAKADYGRVPAYLHGVKATLAAEREAKEAAAAAAAAAAAQPAGMREMEADERLELTTSLEARWARVQTAYRSLPLACDTDPKKRRKEALEAELAQLESDLAVLRRPGKLMVATEDA